MLSLVGAPENKSPSLIFLSMTNFLRELTLLVVPGVYVPELRRVSSLSNKWSLEDAPYDFPRLPLIGALAVEAENGLAEREKLLPKRGVRDGCLGAILLRGIMAAFFFWVDP